MEKLITDPAFEKCLSDAAGNSEQVLECLREHFSRVVREAFPGYSTRDQFFALYGIAMNKVNSNDFKQALDEFRTLCKCDKTQWDKLVDAIEKLGENDIAEDLEAAELKINEANPKSYLRWGILTVTKAAIDRFVDIASP